MASNDGVKTERDSKKADLVSMLLGNAVSVNGTTWGDESFVQMQPANQMRCIFLVLPVTARVQLSRMSSVITRG